MHKRLCEFGSVSLPKIYHPNSSAIKTGITLDRAIVPISRTPVVVVMTGSLKVEFTTDYKVAKFSFIASDVVELISRPKGDILSSPTPDSKPEQRRRAGSKRNSSALKMSSTEVPESMINEFGVSEFIMTKLSMTAKMKVMISSASGAQASQGSNQTQTHPMQSLLTSNTQTSVTMLPPNLSANSSSENHYSPHPGHSVSSGSVKRRLSAVTENGEFTNNATTQSDATEYSTLNININSNHPAAYTSTSHLYPAGSYLNTGLVGSPVPLSSPSTMSNTVSTTSITNGNLGSPIKNTKKARNTSVSSATSTSVKGSAAGSTSNNAGRSRKSTGKKEGNPKRKESISDESKPAVSPTLSVASNRETSIAKSEQQDASSLLGAGKPLTTGPISSLASAPTAEDVSLMSTSLQSNNDGEEMLVSANVDFIQDSVIGLYKPNLEISNSSSWNIDTINTTVASGSNEVDEIAEDDAWKFIDEQLLGYDEQETNSITGSMSIPSLDGVTIPSNSSMLSAVSVNSTAG
ncbi:hypothetical protein BGZ76_003400 [Entomortierella beljakovae]|nr:hypothetical protein BGZ76_003400 [Entomortierella beljakovae]